MNNKGFNFFNTIKKSLLAHTQASSLGEGETHSLANSNRSTGRLIGSVGEPYDVGVNRVP